MNENTWTITLELTEKTKLTLNFLKDFHKALGFRLRMVQSVPYIDCTESRIVPLSFLELAFCDQDMCFWEQNNVATIGLNFSNRN